MEKVSPVYFRGIQFVRLAALPAHQHRAIVEWLPATSLIMIQTEENNILNDCIQYRDYAYWFDNFYEMKNVDTLDAQF